MMINNTLLFNYAECRLTPVWKPAFVSSFYSQQGYFIARYPNALVCLQKGYQQRFLYPKKNCNSTLTLNPLKTENKFFTTTEYSIRAQVNRVTVEQQGYLANGLRERCVSQLFINPGVHLCTH